MNKLSQLTATCLLPMALIACGGGSSSSDDTGASNDSDVTDDSGSDTSGITSDNALGVAQEATGSINETGTSADSLQDAFDAFGDLNSSSSSAVVTGVANSSSACPAGGSFSLSSSSSGQSGGQYTYTASQCEVNSGAVLDGELTISVSSWNSTGTELTFETGSSGFSNGTCSFSGGLVYRFKLETAAVSSGTQYNYTYEYGATSSGFQSTCGNDPVSLAANSTVSNQFSYTLGSGNVVVASSNSVQASGEFQLSSGNETLSIQSQGLEYSVQGTSSSFGSAQCPSSGQVTVTDSDGDTVSIYFGDDAPSPYVVQVTGPDGFVSEFQSCTDFINATP